MTFRGTVINGVIVPDTGQTLPEGTRFNLSPLPGARRRGSRTAAKAPGSNGTRAKARAAGTQRNRAAASHPLTALAAIWKDRSDWKGKSSGEGVAELRPTRPLNST